MNDLDPDLKGVGLQWGYLVPAAVGIALLMILPMAWLTRNTVIAPILLLAASPGIVFPLWLRQRVLRFYRRATWVAANVPGLPRIALVRAVASTGRRRRLQRVEVHVASGAGGAECDYPVLGPPLVEGARLSVEAHLDPEPGGPVVLRSEGRWIWPAFGLGDGAGRLSPGRAT